MKRLLSLASCSLVGRLDGSVCANACVATPRTTAIHVTCVFVSMKVRIFMLFSRPALRMVLNGAPAVDWTVVQPRLSPAGCKGLQRFSAHSRGSGNPVLSHKLLDPRLRGGERSVVQAPLRNYRFTCQTAHSRRQTPSPVFFVEAPGRPVFPRLSSPPDARGWRARGRCRRRFKIRISLRKCGSASRRATRTSLKCPGSFAAVFFRFALSRKRNACAGPRFPGRRLDRGFPDPRLPRAPTGFAVII